MITLYGIKNCDTVKKARVWLIKNNIPYQYHDFRADGLDKIQINHWLAEIGIDVLVNKRSATWKELNDNIKAQFNEKNAADIILENPTLIKRPLLDTGAQKIVGFNDRRFNEC